MEICIKGAYFVTWFSLIITEAEKKANFHDLPQL